MSDVLALAYDEDDDLTEVPWDGPFSWTDGVPFARGTPLMANVAKLGTPVYLYLGATEVITAKHVADVEAYLAQRARERAADRP